MTKATLLVIQGIDQGSRFELSKQLVQIGRGVRNEFRMLDTEVSRHHARIEYRDGSYFVADRNSSNGTFVNGELIQNVRLTHGDQIQVGRCVILFSDIATEQEVPSVAERVDLIGHELVDERSHIVEKVSHDSGHSLLSSTIPAGSQSSQQTLDNLQALYRISEEVVSPSNSIERLLQNILDLTIKVVGADRGCMLISEVESGEILPSVFSHRQQDPGSDRMPVSRSIVDYVIRKGQGVRTSDARRDQRFEPGQSILQAGIREAMCVPMHGRYNLMGVMYVDMTTTSGQPFIDGVKDHFNEEQLRLLIAIGRQSALAVENRRYQEALIKAERMATMGQTITMLSHHIKNILQGVRGGSYLIDMGLNDSQDDLVRKGWGIVEKNQTKIYELVMDMLTFSKERQPALEQGMLNDTVADVCELMQARAEKSQVAFQLKLAEGIPESLYDSEGIHRSVLNIINNAIDAVEETEAGSVLVETGYRRDTDTLFISVSDNGPGIPKQQLTRIFNIFESSKGARGTGLGLAVSQKIIKEHGGEVTVESEPGNGCRFVLEWPRIEDDPHSIENATASE